MKNSFGIRYFKKPTLIALTFIFIFSQNSFANLPEVSTVLFTDQIYGVDSSDYPNHTNFITAGISSGRCAGFSDAICINTIGKTGGTWMAHQVFPPCMTADELSICIEKVEVIKPDGQHRKLKIDRTLTGYKWPAEPTIGLLASSTPSLWIDPMEKGNHGYEVSLSAYLTILKGRELESVDKILIENFEAEIIPYKIIKGDYYPRYSYFSTPTYPLNYGQISNLCLWEEVGECGTRESPSNDRLKLTLHLPSAALKWLSARLKSPTIEVSEKSLGTLNSQSIFRVSVEANPVDTALGLYVKGPLGNIAIYSTSTVAGFGGAPSAISNGSDVFNGFSIWEKDLKVKDSAHNLVWKISGVPRFGMEKGCAAVGVSKIKGIISSNSYLYTEIPVFDGESFLYKMASLHLTPTGEVFKGSLKISIDSEYARCIYGFTQAPIRASISVISSDGSAQNIATEVINEKDGWINLEANNFTFSQPTIKVKVLGELSQKSTITQSNKIEANKLVATKKTITCIKGKTTKKVTGLSPKCPTGYKKK